MKNIVTIGISVLNEEKNIIKLTESLLRQKELGFKIKEIMVISDGSTDNTVEQMRKNFGRNNQVSLIIGKKRLGKPTRVNQMFKLVKSDALVILDGDISVKSRLFIARLVAPILGPRKVDLTSGRAHYFSPKTFFEEIMRVGIDMWCEVKNSTENAAMYTCEGQVRALSRRLYKKILFPQYSAEDVFPYLYSVKNNYKYEYVKSAKVYYGLPSTLGDYIKQHVRFLHSKEVQSKNFDGSLIENNYVISLRSKIFICIKYLSGKPLEVFLYTLFLTVPKIKVHFDEADLYAKWSIISSTKK